MEEEKTLTSPEGEPSDTDNDTAGTENDTQDQDQADQDDQTDVSDYMASDADNTSIEDSTDFKKRYSDSSREAQRLKAELEAKQREIDEWIEFVSANPEVKETVAKHKGTTTDPHLAKLEERLATIERKERELTIKEFEADKKRLGFSFSPEVRKQIGTTASKLSDLPYEEALEIAFIRVNKNDLLKKATDSGKAKAYAQSKTNEDATYTTTNSVSKKQEQTVPLTEAERTMLDSWNLSPEERKSTIARLIEIRNSK